MKLRNEKIIGNKSSPNTRPSTKIKSNKTSMNFLHSNGKTYMQSSISSYVSSSGKKISRAENTINFSSGQKKTSKNNGSKKLRRNDPAVSKSCKNKCDIKNSKIDNMGWPLKTDADENDKKTKSDVLQKRSLKRETIGDSKKAKFMKDNQVKKKKLNSNSFAKYGIHMPSFEEILKQKKDYENYKECLENLPPINTALYLPQFKESQTMSKEAALDCKYMTKEQIKSAFTENFDYLQEIRSGQRTSDRHNKFMLNGELASDLNYSMIVFTNEQKQILAKLLYKKFTSPDLKSSRLWLLDVADSYYFKVLLPEICLKIFMDEHNMTYAEASEYLNQRPVEA